MEYFQNPNPNYTQFSGEYDPWLELEPITNHLVLNEGKGRESALQSGALSENFTGVSGGLDCPTSTKTLVSSKNSGKKSNMDVVPRVSLRTKTEIEVLDDGYRWRKYGKKAVKNSPHARHYYKCSSVGCSVKKRIQRDKDNVSFVITTYDGYHNHNCPSLQYGYCYEAMSL